MVVFWLMWKNYLLGEFEAAHAFHLLFVCFYFAWKKNEGASVVLPSELAERQVRLPLSQNVMMF